MVEEHVRQEMRDDRLHFSEGTKVIENLFRHNIGSTKFQLKIEEYLSEKIEHEQIPELLSMANAIYDPKYIIKHSKLDEDLCTALVIQMDELSIRQFETLFWAVTRDRKLYNGIIAGNNYSKMLTKSLLSTAFKKCVSMKSRGIKYVVTGLNNAFPDGKIPEDLNLEFNNNQLYDRLEKVILTKLDDFTNHDLIYALESFFNTKVGSDKFYEKVFAKLIDDRKKLRPSEFIKLFKILPQISYIYENNMNEELWNDYLS
jgi:hypothetical protein